MHACSSSENKTGIWCILEHQSMTQRMHAITQKSDMQRLCYYTEIRYTMKCICYKSVLSAAAGGSTVRPVCSRRAAISSSSALSAATIRQYYETSDRAGDARHGRPFDHWYRERPTTGAAAIRRPPSHFPTTNDLADCVNLGSGTRRTGLPLGTDRAGSIQIQDEINYN
jgi:hypothetical protein